jgi:AcrR family transcriptional regulator
MTQAIAPPRGDQSSTREAIKQSARRLFAERGVDGVSVRDILADAGQRNSGAVNYHFGTLDQLLRELVVDCAKPMAERRANSLDAMERAGGPARLRDVVEVLVRPIIEGDSAQRGDISFLRLIQFGPRRELFLEAINDRWNLSWERALQHVRRMLPAVAPAVLKQRMVFVELFISSSLAEHEYAMTRGRPTDRTWKGPHTVDNIIDCVTAMLEGPSTEQGPPFPPPRQP